MFDSSWIDLAIGVAFVWFLFSLVVTLVSETITRLLALRSNQLWMALSQLFDGENKSKSILGSVWQLARFQGRPADIAAPVAGSTTQALYSTDAIQGMEPRADPGKKTRISNIPAVVFSQALIEIGVKDAPPGGTIDDYLDQLPGNTPMERQLKALWATAGRDLKEFRAQAEQWFDGQMTRLSAAYKARMRYILVPIGLVVAFGGFAMGFRTDAVALVGDLQHDQNFRSVVVGAASQATKQDLAKLGCPDDEAQQKAKPTECQIDGVAKLSKINLVLQVASPGNKQAVLERLGFLWPGSWPRLGALLGVLVTGVAISFGSTFWFDITRRLVGLRSSSTAGS